MGRAIEEYLGGLEKGLIAHEKASSALRQTALDREVRLVRLQCDEQVAASGQMLRQQLFHTTTQGARDFLSALWLVRRDGPPMEGRHKCSRRAG